MFTMSQGKWIVIMPEKMNIPGDKARTASELTIVSLPHPRLLKNVTFMIKKNGKRNYLFEINRHLDNPCSWIINNDFVKSDGSIMVATPFDPLFIILPLLFNDKSRKFLLLDQLFANTSDSDIGSKVLQCLEEQSQMNNIADAAGVGDLTAYRYSESKALKWLKLKVENTVKQLKETNIFIEEEENLTSDEAVLAYGCGIVCDYLPTELQSILKKHLKVKEKSAKRKNTSATTPAKKAKNEPTDDYSKLVPKRSNSEKKVLSRAQKALDKVDKKGMKTISSFFTVKSKEKA